MGCSWMLRWLVSMFLRKLTLPWSVPLEQAHSRVQVSCRSSECCRRYRVMVVEEGEEVDMIFRLLELQSNHHLLSSLSHCSIHFQSHPHTLSAISLGSSNLQSLSWQLAILFHEALPLHLHRNNKCYQPLPRHLGQGHMCHWSSQERLCRHRPRWHLR